MSKLRPTDAEFGELKRKRDEHVRSVVEQICKEEGIDPATAVVHVSNAGPCYCACPDGPCQHIWDGPEYRSDDECLVSATRSRCGEVAAFRDMRAMP